MKFAKTGQGSLEHLFIIAAVILIMVIATAVVLGLVGGGGERADVGKDKYGCKLEGVTIEPDYTKVFDGTENNALFSIEFEGVGYAYYPAASACTAYNGTEADLKCTLGSYKLYYDRASQRFCLANKAGAYFKYSSSPP